MYLNPLSALAQTSNFAGKIKTRKSQKSGSKMTVLGFQISFQEKFSMARAVLPFFCKGKEKIMKLKHFKYLET